MLDDTTDTCYNLHMSICVHPDSCIGAKPETVLKSVFGYDVFRPFQKEIIESVLAGENTLAVMPTGGGKSLCYQIPALIFDGLTIVISPLIALMQDQVSALRIDGVDAAFLNSTVDWSEYCQIADRIRAGKLKLVYVSPEGLATQRMLELFHSENVKVSCITIDEAHCISEWGHDFRPDYLEIASVRRQFPGAVCLALTATATMQVRDDIVKNLRMEKPKMYVASFNRPNIFLDVLQKHDPFGQIIDCIDKHKNESGIIYCFSRKEVDQLTQALSDKGLSVLNYHAGLTDEERTDHQNRFIRDKVNIMVATVAFGMGINKPDVRFVIHYDIPKSLEQYYQEIGRAGRDGLPAYALLLYSPADIHKIRYFFDENVDSSKAEHLLQEMISYATSRTCRRRILLSYFGEQMTDGDQCAAQMMCCDICAGGSQPDSDVTIPVQKLLCCVLRTHERFGTSYVVDVLLGSRNKRIIDNNHNQLSTWGIGHELSKDDWFELTEQLIATGYLRKTGEYNVLSVTPKGRGVLVSRETVELPVHFTSLWDKKVTGYTPGIAALKPSSFVLHKKNIPSRSIDKNDDESVRIAEELRKWRRHQADEDNVPPYVVLGDRTIADIATKKPKTEKALLAVYGIGSQKAEKIGHSILRIVRNEE